MKQKEDREKLIARLIANTKRKKRYDNLIEIARQIRSLEKIVGNLKDVAKAVGVSTDQLGQFLSVEKLSPEVKKMVEERQIDLINIVHYMRNFDYHDQNKIANDVINGKLTAGDIRVLAPLRKHPSYENIEDLISHVRQTKNMKIFVLYFPVPKSMADVGRLEKAFRNIVGENEVYSLKIKGEVGILELTDLGRKRLREKVRISNLSLRNFVNNIVRNNSR